MLGKIRDAIGTWQVTRSALEFAQPWILKRVVEKETQENWRDAYVETQSSALPKESDLIESLIVFNVKEDENGSLILKARMVLYGHRDRDRFSVRRNSASAELSTARLLLALAQILKFWILTADVKDAHMQSGPIHRELYVMPPK